MKKCRIDGCDRSASKTSMCYPHYNRFRKYGDPKAGSTFQGAPTKWILDCLEYSGNECLLWPFSTNGNGYGKIQIDGKREYVHVIVTTIKLGKRPSGENARHLCGNGNKGCCTPKHLVWGTVSENMIDRIEHGTSNRGERHPINILSEDSVIDIADLLHAGIAANEIAKRYEVNHDVIYSIKYGKSWSWLTGIDYKKRKQ